MTLETEGNEVANFFQSYAEAFSTLSPAGVAGHWSLPASFSAGGKTTVFEDMTDLQASLEKLCQFYRQKGLTGVRAAILGNYPQADGVLLVRVFYRAFGATEAVIAQWEHVYLLRRTGDGLKAVLTIADGEVAEWRRVGAL